MPDDCEDPLRIPIDSRREKTLGVLVDSDMMMVLGMGFLGCHERGLIIVHLPSFFGF